MLAWLLLGCTAIIGPNVRTVKRASDDLNVVRLLDHLENAENAYVRQRAANALGRLTAYQERKSTVLPLRACLNSATEKEFVRTACALALSKWRVAGLDQDIITVFSQVGSESKYWLALALLTMDTPLARSHLKTMETDSDFLMSTMLRQRGIK